MQHLRQCIALVEGTEDTRLPPMIIDTLRTAITARSDAAALAFPEFKAILHATTSAGAHHAVQAYERTLCKTLPKFEPVMKTRMLAHFQEEAPYYTALGYHEDHISYFYLLREYCASAGLADMLPYIPVLPAKQRDVQASMRAEVLFLMSRQPGNAVQTE
jgi:hypothetical protein